MSNKFPSTRRRTVVPIPKNGNDSRNPNKYRPISLTSCSCKNMELMITNRLTWFPESNGLIANLQSRFRKKRGTIDHLVYLETFIREAFITKKKHLTAIFFDLEKAYDSTWKYGILRDVHTLGLKGRLPGFLSNFDENFKVHVRFTLSDLHNQEERILHGSNLFDIKN